MELADVDFFQEQPRDFCLVKLQDACQVLFCKNPNVSRQLTIFFFQLFARNINMLPVLEELLLIHLVLLGTNIF